MDVAAADCLPRGEFEEELIAKTANRPKNLFAVFVLQNPPKCVIITMIPLTLIIARFKLWRL